MSKLTNSLNEIYKNVGNEWVKQNSIVFHYARNHNMTIGGSIGMALTHKKPFKLPGDIDLFTNNNEDSLEFIMDLIEFLSAKSNTYYRLLVNNGTKYVLDGVINHHRLIVPFWKPICVMTLKTPIRKFYHQGLSVQYYDDIVKCAKSVEKIDGKNRTVAPVLPVNKVKTNKIVVSKTPPFIISPPEKNIDNGDYFFTKPDRDTRYYS
jgi:hypothetical protein